MTKLKFLFTPCPVTKDSFGVHFIKRTLAVVGNVIDIFAQPLGYHCRVVECFYPDEAKPRIFTPDECATEGSHV